MLVLSRKVGEKIVLGGRTVITVCLITPTKVRLGIEAPQEIGVSRAELLSRPDWCAPEQTPIPDICQGVPLAHLSQQEVDRCKVCPFCDKQKLQEAVTRLSELVLV